MSHSHLPIGQSGNGDFCLKPIGKERVCRGELWPMNEEILEVWLKAANEGADWAEPRAGLPRARKEKRLSAVCQRSRFREHVADFCKNWNCLLYHPYSCIAHAPIHPIILSPAPRKYIHTPNFSSFYSVMFRFRIPISASLEVCRLLYEIRSPLFIFLLSLPCVYILPLCR